MGAGFNSFPGRKGEFTIIRGVQEESIPAGSGKVTWEGNFGATWHVDAKILESDINGPTEDANGRSGF